MPLISKRAKPALLPPFSYAERFAKALNDLHHFDKNPKGYVCLTVAENKVSFFELLEDKLLEIIKSITKEDLQHDNFPPFYDDLRGYHSFKEALSRHFSKILLNKSQTYHFNPDNFVIGSGCTSLLESLSATILDEHDSIIIPSPFYPAFRNDLSVRGNIKIIKATRSAPEYKLTEEILEGALKAAGSPVKALLLTNPDNPLGTVYSKEELKAALNFARNHDIFLICDEIYACSVYGEATFVSMSEICLEQGQNLGEDIILLYGFSKDFCLSGIRVGILYTENQKVMKVFENYAAFTAVSSFTQLVLTKLLNEEDFVENYLEESRNLIGKYAQKTSMILDELGIPYIEAKASLFISAYFGDVIKKRYELEEISFEDEHKFFEELAEEHKIILTPGYDCRFDKPGYFRLCYAFAGEEALNEFQVRMKDVLSTSRNK